MPIETFKGSGACVCAYCKEDIDVNDYNTIVMSLSRYIGIEQSLCDAMDCEQKIVTQGRLISITFHRKCLLEFFKNSTINITERIINDIGTLYPAPTLDEYCHPLLRERFAKKLEKGEI